jgi:hypothetical protein
VRHHGIHFRVGGTPTFATVTSQTIQTYAPTYIASLNLAPWPAS